MRLFNEGDRSGAICEACGDQVATVMRYIDFTPTDSGITVPDVLIAVCEVCGNPAAIPHQSTSKIVEYMRAGSELPQETINANVPRVLEDALSLVASTVGGRGKDFRPAMIRYYLNLLASDPEVASQVDASSRADLAKGKGTGRIALKISPRQWAEAKAAAKLAGMKSASDILRGVAALAAEDFRITLKDQPESAKPSRAAKARVQFLKDMAQCL